VSVCVGVTVSVGVGAVVSVGVGVGVTESVGVGATEGDGVVDGGAVDGPGLGVVDGGTGGRGVAAGVIATNGCGAGWVVGARAKIGVPLGIAEPGGGVAPGEAFGAAALLVGGGAPRMG